MSIIGTFNGWNIVAMPTFPKAKTIEFGAQDTIAVWTSPFTGQQQVLDWQAGWLELNISLPPLTQAQAQQWAAFMMQLRGTANVFQIGDPTATSPAGSGAGSPVVNGANQTGITLATRGWTASASNVLLAGDWIQIGYRLYRVLDPVSADGSGHAALNIWPQIRESPADGTAIALTNTQGLFRLKTNLRKWSVSDGHIYGMQFEAREAL